MTQNRLTWRTLGLPVYIVLALLLVFGGIFLVELLTFDASNEGSAEPVSAESYQEQVNTLLANANSDNAEAALEKYGCTACHRAAEADIAPSWVGIASRAAERRPPMSASAYLYESIIYPSAYVVEGYPDSMIKNYGERISDQELGDIIAYLMTPDAH